MNKYKVCRSDKYHLIKTIGNSDYIMLSDNSPEQLKEICRKLNDDTPYSETDAYAEFAKDQPSIFDIFRYDDDLNTCYCH